MEKANLKKVPWANKRGKHGIGVLTAGLVRAFNTLMCVVICTKTRMLWHSIFPTYLAQNPFDKVSLKGWWEETLEETDGVRRAPSTVTFQWGL